MSTGSLDEKIEHQRGRLQKASAILLCAVLATHEGIGADVVADAAVIARELVDAAVVALDAVELSRDRGPPIKARCEGQ